MCAIAGIVGNNLKEDLDNLQKIQKSMEHRGPDNSSHHFLEPALFIHNRLTVIDLNTRANQPFFSNDKKKVIVFNGEIYNYLELKKILEEHFQFKTTSDTEVLLAAYEHWGENFLNKLEGMFALAIFDYKKDKAFFARDRFGQKPLFFWKNEGKLYFSSEIKGIIAAGYKAEANYKTWFDYLYFGATDHTSETFFKNISQLLPGESASFNIKEGLTIKKWYDFNEVIKRKKNFFPGDIKKNIASKTLNSVKINSRADVPISIALSGGLDSSLLMSICYNKRFLNKKPKCFSFQFDKDYSEKEFIDASTDFYGFKSNYVNFSKFDLKESIIPFMWHLESPSGGLANLAIGKLCHEIKKNNIKVVLDGTGPDECFGGYELHHLQYLYNLRRKKDKKFNNSLNLFLKNWGISREETLNKLGKFDENFTKTVDGYKFTNTSILTEKFLDDNKTRVKDYKLDNNTIEVKNSLSEYIQKTKIPRNCRMLDRVSMAFGIELRFPFLEHAFLEYGLSLDPKSYFLLGRSKSILRETFKKIIAPKTRKQKKMTIQTPQNLWLKIEPMKSFIIEIINSESFAKRGIFNQKKVINEYEKYVNGNSKTSFYIWQIISTEIWFRLFIDKKYDISEIKFNFN